MCVALARFDLIAAGNPGAVLFACTSNRVRSPIAAALLRRRLAGRVYVDSCGLDPGGEVDPFATAVLDELGLDLCGHRSKGFDELEDGSFDLVISLSPEAHHRAIEFTRHLAAEVEYWPTADPTTQAGSRAQRLDAYRAVRDALAGRLAARFPRLSGSGS